jgi:hypothetical protein
MDRSLAMTRPFLNDRPMFDRCRCQSTATREIYAGLAPAARG